MERRELLKGLGGAAGVATAGGIGVLATGSAAASVNNLHVDGDHIETDDGTISAATLDLDADWQFDNLDHDANSVELWVYATDGSMTGSDQLDHGDYNIGTTANGNQEPNGAFYRDPGVKADSGEVSFESLDLTASTDISLSDFTDQSEDDEYKQTEITVMLKMAVYGRGDKGKLIDASRRTTFTIKVKNLPASAKTGGEGNASVEGENQSP